MKPRSLIPLVIGLAVGFFAIKMGVDMVKRAKGSDGDQRSVLVSARQIEGASRIEESMIKPKNVAAGLIGADAFTDVKVLAGRVTSMSIPPGVPITKAMLAPPGAEPGLRARIPAGCRAVSVSVNEESAVAGFISPGAHVDVSAVNSKAGLSKLILSDVEVGAVGQSLNQIAADGKTVKITKSVTLFLKPEQVEILNAHAGAKGQIRLALRGHRDPDRADSFWSQLLGKAAENAAAMRTLSPENNLSPRSHIVEVVRGSETQRLVFVESSDHGHYRLVSDENPPVKHSGGKSPGDAGGQAHTEMSE